MDNYILNRIEMMSNVLDLQEGNLVKSTSSLTLKEKRDRLLKIEQKLEAITIHKQNQARDQTEEDLTRRVLDLEAKCAEEIKSMEAKVRELKEGFSEMKLREGELTKKCDLSRKNRIVEIRQLQKKLTTFTAFESKERKDLENSLISIIEKKEKQLNIELAHVKQVRIESLNKFQRSLAENLPELGMRIETRLEEIEVKLELLHQEIRKQAETLCSRIEQDHLERQNGIRNVHELIGKLTEEIKNDIKEERQERQSSRLKLLALFQNACGRLNLI